MEGRRGPNLDQNVFHLSIEDYSQQEVNDILHKFSQRPGEPLIVWMVRTDEVGAEGIMTDGQDCTKFLTVSSNSFMQNATCAHKDSDADTNLLA